MGYLHKGVCYPDLPTVKAEFCAQQWATWGNTTTAYTFECTASNFALTTWSSCRKSNGGACSSFTHAYPTFPTCNWEQQSSFSLDYGLLAMALLVTIWGGKQLINLFNRPHQEA